MATIQTNSKRGTINEGINLNQGRDFSDLWAWNVYWYSFFDNKDFLQVSFSLGKTFLSRGWCFVKYNKSNEPFTWDNNDEWHWMKCELTQNTIGDTLSGVGYLYIEVVSWLTDTGSTTFDGSDYFSIKFDAVMPTVWPHIALLYQINATTGTIITDYRKHRDMKLESLNIQSTLTVGGNVTILWNVDAGDIISNGTNITNIINTGWIDFGDGSDGALLVATGNTVVLPLTKIYQYTTLTVQVGGTLRFTGDWSFWAKILVQWAVAIDGTIECRGAINKDGWYYYKDVKEIIMTGAWYNSTIVWWIGWALVAWVGAWSGGKWWNSWLAWSGLWGAWGWVLWNWSNWQDNLSWWGWWGWWGWSTVNWWLSWSNWWVLNWWNGGIWGNWTAIVWTNPWGSWGSWWAWFNTWTWGIWANWWIWNSSGWWWASNWWRWGNGWDSWLNGTTWGNWWNWWSVWLLWWWSSWGFWGTWGNWINWDWGNWGIWWNTDSISWSWGNWGNGGNSRYANWWTWGSWGNYTSWNPWSAWNWWNGWDWRNWGWWWNWGNSWAVSSSWIGGRWWDSKPWNIWILIVAWWAISFTWIINAQWWNWGNWWLWGNRTVNVVAWNWWNWGNGANWSDIVLLSNVSVTNTWTINNLWGIGGIWGAWGTAFSAPFNWTKGADWLPWYPWKKVISLIYS